MVILAVDWETFYDTKSGYSLSKMPMEEYIFDKRFRVHIAGVSIDGAPSQAMTHNELVHLFGGLDWSKTVFIAHNCAFDGAILVWKYGHMPSLFVDTRGLANAFIRPYSKRVDLDSCARFCNLPLKSGILPKTDGMTLEDIIANGYYDQYCAYACQDNDNALALAKLFLPRLNAVEKWRLDWSIRNYVRGRLKLDVSLLQQSIDEIEAERKAILAEMDLADPTILRSPKRFADYLKSLGVVVQYTNGKNGEIPAISKKSPFVRELLRHEDPQVRAAIKARLYFSSSIDITRSKRLLRMAEITGGRMLIPTIYYAAHTGRPGGTEGVNVTNFRKPDRSKGERVLYREAIHCKPGMVMVDADASQIEARICCWLAKCKPLLEAFRDGVDVYCKYGTEVVYGREITRADEKERQICKVEVLSLQYGVGADTLYERLQADGIMLERVDALEHVDKYRRAYPEILEFGAEVVELLGWCATNDKEVSHRGIFKLSSRGVRLPDGRELLYDKLQKNGRELIYWSHKWNAWNKLYAGSMNENICQALANTIVGTVHAKYREDTVFMIYDSIVRHVPLIEAQRVGEETVATLSTPPSWAPDLPLAAEFKVKHHL